MCGIIGVHGQGADRADLTPALIDMTHRGPDGRHSQQVPDGLIGHTRLAIVDIDGGDQPIPGREPGTWLVCNGEIYNAPELRAQFADYPYRSDSDNEVILALYERYGHRLVEYLNGMYAFALVTPEDLLLARDPLGIKPLYYGHEDGKLYFASEIKALQHYLRDVQEFPPGSLYTRRTGPQRFYDLQAMSESLQQQHTQPTDLAAIRDTLRRAVRRRLMADVPVGVYLSGGLDSTIVATLAAQEMPGIHSFAVGVPGSEDIRYARRVAEVIGTTHHEYLYSPEEMLEALPDIIYHLESFDASLVRSAIPNYFLSRLTAQYVTVVLTGEGADELYAGYHYLKELPPARLHEELVDLTRLLYSCNLRRCDRMTMAHSLEGRVPFLDVEFVQLSLSISVDHKIKDGTEKWVLRKAFEDVIPREVAWRVKSQFAQGAGSYDLLARVADREISDAAFQQERADAFAQTGHFIDSKEELLYYRVYRRYFNEQAARLVQTWKGG